MTLGSKLGLLGSLFVLTSIQEKTTRSKLDIWRIPNSSLTVAPYAFWKEREKGIDCSNSKYINKYPTRSPRKGESEPPLQHVQVCQAWNAYFDVAEKDTAVQRPAPNVPFISEAYHVRMKQNAAQALLWIAHSRALLHAYWQYTDLLAYNNNLSTPRKEYAAWSAWNYMVGHYVPQMNSDTCAKSSATATQQLMPMCIRGARESSGREIKCEGGNADGLSWFDEQFGNLVALGMKSYESIDLKQSIDSFINDETGVEDSYKYIPPTAGIGQTIVRMNGLK